MIQNIIFCITFADEKTEQKKQQPKDRDTKSFPFWKTFSKAEGEKFSKKDNYGGNERLHDNQT